MGVVGGRTLVARFPDIFAPAWGFWKSEKVGAGSLTTGDGGGMMPSRRAQRWQAGRN